MVLAGVYFIGKRPVCPAVFLHILGASHAKEVRKLEENHILLRGRLDQVPVFSHESHGKRFFRQAIAVPRLSGAVDTLNLLLPGELSSTLPAGEDAEVTGAVRSFNNRSGTGSKLVITVLVHTLLPASGPPENLLTLSGVLCKPPVFRRTPLGREICDLMLAVPRRYGRSDYLPCIAWGATAARAAGLAVGDRVALEGRLQSRTYTKLENDRQVSKVAFEVSVSSLEVL